jgi:hypothetical protein
MARLRRKVSPTEFIDPLEALISDLSTYSFAGKVNELIESNVQDLARILEIQQRGMFDPKQSAAFCSAFDPSSRERHLISGLCSRDLAEEFGLASKWFAWRKHPELAQRYMERARVVYEILSEQEMQRHG